VTLELRPELLEELLEAPMLFLLPSLMAVCFLFCSSPAPLELFLLMLLLSFVA
jgi:hypothetical protein